MEQITPKLLEDITNSLMLNLEVAEYELLAAEFAVILEQMRLVQVIAVDDIEPMHYPFPLSRHQLRPDTSGSVSDWQEISQNAPLVEDNYIVVNKVIE